MLDHGGANRMSGKVTKREAVPGEGVGDDLVKVAGQHAFAHQLAGRLHRLGISVGHLLRAPAGLSLNQGSRKLDPVPAGAGDLQRVEKEVAFTHSASAWDLEVRLGLAVAAGEHDVHHSWTRTAREEDLNRGRHDFGFRLADREAVHQRKEAVMNDVHRVTNLDQFFFALDRARHVEEKVKGDKFEWRLL